MDITAAPSPTRWVDQVISEIDAALAASGPSRPVLREDLCNIGRPGFRRGIRDDDASDVPDRAELSAAGLAALARTAPRWSLWHVERVA